MNPTTPTLQQLQDDLAILQAQSKENDDNFALETAQYNQRKDNFATQISTLQTQITSLQTSTP